VRIMPLTYGSRGDVEAFVEPGEKIRAVDGTAEIVRLLGRYPVEGRTAFRQVWNLPYIPDYGGSSWKQHDRHVAYVASLGPITLAASAGRRDATARWHSVLQYASR
jgi:hypothetical protein